MDVVQCFGIGTKAEAQFPRAIVIHNDLSYPKSIIL